MNVMLFVYSSRLTFLSRPSVLFFTVIDCSKPEVPTGAELIGDRFTVGSEVKYKCKPGHKMTSGSERRKCQQDGKWDGSVPDCKCKSICSFFVSYLFSIFFPPKKHTWHPSLGEVTSWKGHVYSLHSSQRERKGEKDRQTDWEETNSN